MERVTYSEEHFPPKVSPDSLLYLFALLAFCIDLAFSAITFFCIIMCCHNALKNVISMSTRTLAISIHRLNPQDLGECLEGCLLDIH